MLARSEIKRIRVWKDKQLRGGSFIHTIGPGFSFLWTAVL